MTRFNQLSIVPGTLLDLRPVMDVMNDSFDPAYGEAWTEAQCSGLLTMPGVWMTLARDQEVVAGFSLARIIDREAELLLLAVARKRQGRGIGRVLIDAFVRAAEQRGAELVHLEVREGNPAANLYKEAGFSQAGRRRNYYRGRNGEMYHALTLSRKAPF